MRSIIHLFAAAISQHVVKNILVKETIEKCSVGDIVKIKLC